MSRDAAIRCTSAGATAVVIACWLAITTWVRAASPSAADSRRITNQIGFNNAIADATNTGLGAIVDADLAKESARLQSLQVKQQLSSQALSIANQSPQSLLGLFR